MSNESSSWSDSPSPPPVPQPAGRGCLGSTLMILGGISLFMMVACCLLIGVGGYLFSPRLVVVPAEIQGLATAIAPLKIPAGFEPEKGIELNNTFVVSRVVIFREGQGRGRLRVSQMGFKFGGDEFIAQEKKSLNDISDKTSEGFEQLKITESEERIFSVSGNDVSFKFETGEALASKTKFRQVSGTFRTAAGSIDLLLQVEEAAYNEDAVTELLQSLK